MKINYSIICMLIFISCSNEDPQTPNQKTEDLLSNKIWELVNVTIDDNASDLYTGLTISFSPKKYTSTNGGDIWAPAGTWDFIGENGDKIERDDGLIITIISINADVLIISFYWDMTIYTGDKTDSLEGLHIMTFNRKN